MSQKPRFPAARVAENLKQPVKENLRHADRAIILNMGKVVFDGAAQEVVDNAHLRQEYLAI